MEYSRRYPATVNSSHEADNAIAAAKATRGSQGVCVGIPPSMASEAFAFMLQALPGAYIWLGADGRQPVLHCTTLTMTSTMRRLRWGQPIGSRLRSICCRFFESTHAHSETGEICSLILRVGRAPGRMRWKLPSAIMDERQVGIKPRGPQYGVHLGSPLLLLDVVAQDLRFKFAFPLGIPTLTGC